MGWNQALGRAKNNCLQAFGRLSFGNGHTHVANGKGKMNSPAKTCDIQESHDGDGKVTVSIGLF